MKYNFLYLLLIGFLFSCSDNKTAVENFNSGLEYFNSNDFSSALKEFSKAAQKDNENINAIFYKGLSEVKLQKNQEALNTFQKVIDLDTSYYQAFVERAKLKIALGDFAECLS